MDYNLKKGIESQIEEHCKQLVQDAQNERIGLMTGSIIEISFDKFRTQLLDSLVNNAGQLGATPSEISEVVNTTIDRMRSKYLY
jgi:hypothetical protein